MKKIFLIAAIAAMFIGCTKDNEVVNPTPVVNDGESVVTLRFSPYEITPMKTVSNIATVCSKLDIWIIDTVNNDTIVIHKQREGTGNNATFGNVTATLQTNKTYRLLAMAHNTDEMCTFENGIFAFSENKIKQTLYADTVFSPADGLSLNIVMQRIVGMFKMIVTDNVVDGVTGFRFHVFSAGCKWNIAGYSEDRGERIHTINGTTQNDYGYVVYNVYVMGDNMIDTLNVNITAEAIDSNGDAQETRYFENVPIKDGYITQYTGTFFITFDMGFSFGVGDWGTFGNYTY